MRSTKEILTLMKFNKGGNAMFSNMFGGRGGCGCGNDFNNCGGGCSDCAWIIILILILCNCGCNIDPCFLIIILLIICGCGCGCNDKNNC